MKLLFVTHNTHKLEEIQTIVGEEIEIASLFDIGFFDEIPENNYTLEENALEKARTLHNLVSLNCFADDTGLEIEALGGAPGVFSARYAGEEHDSKANMKKVLKEMKGVANRKARFRTVIALIWNRHEYLFEGIVNGTILTQEQGNEGFGYDPIFQPEGYIQSFAELPSNEKNRISHRGEAVNKLIRFLESAKAK